MNARNIALSISALFLVLLATACGTSQTVGTGIPASGAEKFYFHMQQEASARGFETHRDMELLTLSVTVDPDMSLDYSVMGDEIVVTMHVDDLEDDSEEALHQRFVELRQLNRSMIAVAAERAERARAFELSEL